MRIIRRDAVTFEGIEAQSTRLGFRGEGGPRADERAVVMSRYRIGDVTRLLGLSADTLRYYEKIGLLGAIARMSSGARLYDDEDLARLRFIRRAQKMQFTLAEIAELLTLRDAPEEARQEARMLTRRKLAAVEEHLEALELLRRELRDLLERCAAAEAGCPIIETMNDPLEPR